MDFTDFTAGKDDDSRRLDRVAQRLLPDRGYSEVQTLMRKRLVKLNGARVKPDTRVSEGDVISVASFLLSSEDVGEKSCQMSSPQSVPQSASEPEFETVFENEHILVINKPWGINVQPSKNGGENLASMVSSYLAGQKSGSSLSFSPGPLHRLDRLTTGLLAFSKSSLGARWFTDAIKNHAIRKSYLGLAEGRLEEECRWCDRISDTPEKSVSSFHTVCVSKDGAEAITTARPLAYGKTLSLVQYDIETGRKHQIRCQTSFHGHPLEGDVAYGGKSNAEGTFFLHAAHLTFPKDNPLGLPPDLSAPVPQGFQKKLILGLINWSGQIII